MAFITSTPLRLATSIGSRSICHRNLRKPLRVATMQVSNLSTAAPSAATKRRPSTAEKTIQLRKLLQQDPGERPYLLPCCFDALSARLVEEANFPFTFMGGFGTAGAMGLPDAGLLGYKEMVDNISEIASAINIPLFGDADTGFGNALNVRRTVIGYYEAGASGIFLEDQVNPKRCGHTAGKAVVDFEEACRRVQAAVDASKELYEDENDMRRPVIVARTDAGKMDFEEAVRRAKAFQAIGADVSFISAPANQDEMRAACGFSSEAVHLCTLIEGGASPIYRPEFMREIGYKIVVYPLTLFSASMKAQRDALKLLQAGDPDAFAEKDVLMEFPELKRIVGFDDYNTREGAYSNFKVPSTE